MKAEPGLVIGPSTVGLGTAADATVAAARPTRTASSERNRRRAGKDLRFTSSIPFSTGRALGRKAQSRIQSACKLRFPRTGETRSKDVSVDVGRGAESVDGHHIARGLRHE